MNAKKIEELILEMENKIRHQCDWIKQAGHYYEWYYHNLVEQSNVHGRSLDIIFADLKIFLKERGSINARDN